MLRSSKNAPHDRREKFSLARYCACVKHCFNFKPNYAYSGKLLGWWYSSYGSRISVEVMVIYGKTPIFRHTSHLHKTLEKFFEEIQQRQSPWNTTSSSWLQASLPNNSTSSGNNTVWNQQRNSGHIESCLICTHGYVAWARSKAIYRNWTADVIVKYENPWLIYC